MTEKKATWGGKRKGSGNPGNPRVSAQNIKTPFNTRLPAHLILRLGDYCRANGQTRTWVLETALREYLKDKT